MDQNSKPSKGRTVPEGIWLTQLFGHIEYFNSHNDLREQKMVLPFGLERERPPRKKKAKKDTQAPSLMHAARRGGYGAFTPDPAIEDKKPWAPRTKQLTNTTDQVKYKPTLFIIRHDPSTNKSMYLEQDLMAKPISKDIEKKTGFTYRVQEDKNVVVRKFVSMVDKDTFLDIVDEFVLECNKVLFMFCNTS